MKGVIKTIHLFIDGACTVRVQAHDKTETSIEIPRDVLTGKTIEERFAICMERGNRYIACLPEQDWQVDIKTAIPKVDFGYPEH